jgi:acyl-coenzyme A synthetase/AMP-(fatty) acid ligase
MAVVDSILAHARAAPDKAALTHNGRVFSYRELAARIARARSFLRGQGVGAERVAIICIRALPDAWSIGLALRSLGVTTVNGRSPEDVERLGLEAASVVSMAAEPWPGLAEAAARAGAPLALAPRDLFAGAAEAATPDFAPAPPGGHILLTSGTTGAYKKVLIDAADEARNAPARAALLGLTGDSVIDVFDFGGWTAFGYQWPVCAWSLGAGVVTHQGPERWRSLTTPGLTHALVQPQLLAELLATPQAVDLRNDAVTLIVGAGVLSSAQWRGARERLTGDVRNLLGSTEVGSFALTRIETAEDLAWHRIAPPFEVQAVDEHDRPAPTGTQGIVRIRTTGVEGYLGDPEASGAFFRNGFFYPGDLGVVRQDGRLSLQGRITDLINVMGDKIATLPIERALQEALGAQAVCVFSAAGEDGEAVHVAIQPGRPITPFELRAALTAALPGLAQVRVHAVKAFPRNHMGKIERAALKAQLLVSPNPL